MIRINGLKKHYDRFDLDCTLQVQPGRVTGLVGQNGAGKSTTFKALLGLIRVDGGEATVLGKDLAAITPADREDLGVVLSDSGFSGYLCVKDLLPILQVVYRRFDEKWFLEQAQKQRLPLDQQIRTFSTGMKARVKLLTALSHGAKLLILDEPTAGLDVIARDELLDLLRDYMVADEDRAILISSHISSDLETLCDDLYMIHDGRIVLHEDTDVLLADYAVLKVDEKQYDNLDKRYLLRRKKEPYGWRCLTDQKQFYLDNHPDIAVEKGSIDDAITMLIRGESI